MQYKSPSEAAVAPRGTLATDVRGVWRGLGGRANMLGGSVLLAACVLPFVADPYVLEVATMALLYIVLCLGLNVVVGYAGLLDLGYAAFFAVGAYTTGILTSQFDWSFWATLPVAAVAAAVAGVVIGMPTLRLRSDYLAIVTLGFGEIMRLIARNLTITGGASGLYGIERPMLFGIRLDRNIDFYFMFLILVVFVIYVSYSLSRSRIGRAWLYVRFDEDAAAGIGINRVAVKLYAYVVGAVIASLAGTIFAVKMTAISPESFTFSQSLAILLGVVLGGMGKIPGVILGAIAMTLLPELMRDAGIYRPLVTAVGLFVLMLFRPQGLWPDGRA
jgi:branched-chain amino acid transport system permease protein